MYDIKQLTGNLVLITPVKKEEKMVKGLYVPNSRGKHTVCKVLLIGDKLVSTQIAPNDLVLVPSELLVNGSLDRDLFTFQEDKQEYFLIQEYGIDAILSHVDI